MNRKVVDPHSVQAQFAQLSKDNEELRNAAIGAERERRREELLLQGLRQTQTVLNEKIRAAHAVLGTENKKRQLLRNEETKLKKVMEQDYQNIQTLHEKLITLEKNDRKRKEQFVKEMDRLNDDLHQTLQQYEEQTLVRLISHDSCQLIQELLKKRLDDSNIEMNDSHHHHDNHNSWLTNKLDVQNIEPLLKEIEEKSNLLESTMTKYKEQRSKMNEALQKTKELREQMKLISKQGGEVSENLDSE